MDRNIVVISSNTVDRVALRKESVDRNILLPAVAPPLLSSLSARRAWIEIANASHVYHNYWSLSARRAWIEMSGGYGCAYLYLMSLSARRAWIEIGMSGLGCRARHVALRKESVDRNS